MAVPIIGGKYALLRKLGSGGMAEVFLARQTGFEGFEKLVVVKRILPHLMENESFVRMFLDEARTAADLRHPHVVNIFDISEDQGTYFLAMEFLHGQDCRRIARRASDRGEPVPLQHAIQVVMDVAAGLHHAHTKVDLHGRPLCIIHRDVSPQNIIVTYDGVAKIVDFGVAKAASQSAETAAGVLKGKYAYMSPEQAAGLPVDQRADQFALGVVLFELTTMRKLFPRDNDIMTLHAVVECQVPRPSLLVSDYPPALERILTRMLSRNPDDRFPDCEQLRLAMEDFMATHGIVQSPARVGQWLRGLFVDALEKAESLNRALLDAETQALPPPLGDAATVASGTRRPALRTPSSLHSMATALRGHTDVSSPGGPEEGPPTVMEPRRTNLSPTPRSFIGRGADLAAVQALFVRGQRLVTVMGPAGTGKSRFCEQYALAHLEQLTADGTGGLWLCDMTEAHNVDGVCAALGRALELPLTAGKTAEDMVTTLGQALARRPPLLVVMDNFDRVVEVAASTLGRWLELAPKARFLVSSRELLRMPGEVPYRLAPLGVPSPEEDETAIRASEAVQLFVARAQDVRQGFELSAHDAPLVAQIVRELDGLPLAIELAAARMSVLTPNRLLERLPRRFELLADTRRDSGTGSRQSALRSAIDWSWNLLSPAEQSALAQCSVFRGDFTMEAAEEVVDLSAHAGAPWVLDVVQALRDKSLVHTYEPKELPGELRLGLYVSIREYAAEKLQRSGEELGAAARHASYFLKAGMEWCTGVDGHGGGEKLVRLAMEHQNLLVVLRRALTSQPATAASARQALLAILALDPVLGTRGPFGEHLDLLDRTAELAESLEPDGSLRARLLESRGRARQARGHIAEAMLDFEQALRLAHEAKDRRGEAVALLATGKLMQVQGRHTDASSLCEQALTIYREIGERWGEGKALLGLGSVHHDLGNFPVARVHYEKALGLFRKRGDERAEARVLLYVAILDQESGRLSEARRHYERSLAIYRRVRERRLEAILVGYLGFLAQEQEQLAEARTSYQAAHTMLREVSDARYEALFLGALGGVHGCLDQREEAQAELEAAEAILRDVDDPLFLLAVTLSRGHLDLSRERAARAAGNLAAAAEHREAALARVEEGEAAGGTGPDGEPVGLARAAQTDESRFALRFLKRALARDKP